MNEFFNTRVFRAGQMILAKVQLVDSSGSVYLEAGEEARIMMCDPVKYPDRPYGLRKADEHTTKNFFAAEQLEFHPGHPKSTDSWEVKPESWYRHPKHPRHEELRAAGWKIDPATI